jgi:hypothetical protein
MELTFDLNPDYCYSAKQLAFLWNVSDETIRRRFSKEPGVMIHSASKVGRRAYRTLRIPGRIAIRVKSRMTVGEAR